MNNQGRGCPCRADLDGKQVTNACCAEIFSRHGTIEDPERILKRFMVSSKVRNLAFEANSPLWGKVRVQEGMRRG